MKKFKEFFVSYWELTKASGKWMKEHWLGYTILCVLITVWQFRGFISRWIQDKLSERKEKRGDLVRKEESI